MLSNILSYHASPAESTVRSSSPLILHIHAIWMSWSLRDCSIVPSAHHPEKTTKGPMRTFQPVWLCSKVKMFAVLLCARCILLNVTSNNGGPKLLAAVIPKLHAISIPPLIADQSGHLRSVDVCIWTFPALNILLLVLRCFTCGSPLFAKKPVIHSVSPHAPNVLPPVLSISLPTCSASSLSQRKSVTLFGNLPLAVTRRVREWISS